MKPASNEDRELFITHTAGWIKYFQKQVTEGKLTERELACFNQGLDMGVGILLSLTDSREDNKALYRITNTEGEFIPFYADNHPSGFIKEADGNFKSEEGLIVAIQNWDINKINS